MLVSDIEMPGEDGYSLIRRVRALDHAEQGGHVPAIALTAYGRTQDRTRSLAAGYQHARAQAGGSRRADRDHRERVPDQRGLNLTCCAPTEASAIAPATGRTITTMPSS